MPDPALKPTFFDPLGSDSVLASKAIGPGHPALDTGPGFNDHVTLKTVDVIRVGADWKFGRSLTAQSLRGMSTVQRRVPLPRAMVRLRPYAQVFAVE
jgi:hypothetical protein